MTIHMQVHTLSGLRWRRCFLAHKTHTTFMAYYNVPVESKTVKFDIIVHLRDSTFTPAATQSPTTYKFKDILTIIWQLREGSFPGPTTLLEVTGEPDSYIITLVLEPESLPSCIETVLGSKQSSTPLDACPQQAKQPSSTPFYGSTSKQTILQGKFLHSGSNMTPLLIIRTAYTAGWRLIPSKNDVS